MYEKYTELVRDSVPYLIQNKTGISVESCKVNDSEVYKERLFTRLAREFDELKEDISVDRVSDMIELLTSIAGLQCISRIDLTRTLNRKRKIEGDFDGKSCIKGTESQTGAEHAELKREYYQKKLASKNISDSVNVLNLPVRIANALYRKRILELSELLVIIDLKRGSLTNLRGVGEKSLAELIEQVKRFRELYIEGEVEYIPDDDTQDYFTIFDLSEVHNLPIKICVILVRNGITSVEQLRDLINKGEFTVDNLTGIGEIRHAKIMEVMNKLM